MSDSLRFVCPNTRQLTRHKDSTTILVLTANRGDLMIRLTLSSLEVKTFYKRCVQIRGELLGSESRSNAKLKGLQDSSDLGQEAYRRDSG